MIEMSRESQSDWISAASRWTHSTAEVDIDQISEFTDRFTVVPALEVHPLTDELNGRLSAEYFERRHV